MITRFGLVALLTLLSPAEPAQAWDAHGHRAITLLAVDGLAEILAGEQAAMAGEHAVFPPELAFLAPVEARHMVAWQSAEPDRWRGVPSPFLAHENSPDHYINIENLEPFGLTFSTIPPLRYEYVRALVIAKHEHPDDLPPYNEITDPTRTQEFPGYLPHAIVEHYAKLTSSFRTLRTLEKIADPARAPQLEMARANVMVQMGLLSHFVGDAAQPLHTTAHHHGWVGPNPDGFTTDRGIHAYIDGTILTIHGLDYAALRPGCRFGTKVDIANPWNDVLNHIERSFERVRPLYELKKSGELEGEAGKAFISGRLTDAGETLAAMYAAAWRASAIDDKAVADFKKYDNFDPATIR